MRINWSERISVTSEQGRDPVPQITEQMDRITQGWAVAQGVHFDFSSLAISSATTAYTVSITGPDEPDIEPLLSELEDFFATVEDQLVTDSANSSEAIQTEGSDQEDNQETSLDVTVLFAEQVEL